MRRIRRVFLFAVGFNDIVSTIPPSVNCSLVCVNLPFMERQLQSAIHSITALSDQHDFLFSQTKTSTISFRKSGSRGIYDLLLPYFILYDLSIQVKNSVRFFMTTSPILSTFIASRQLVSLFDYFATSFQQSKVSIEKSSPIYASQLFGRTWTMAVQCIGKYLQFTFVPSTRSRMRASILQQAHFVNHPK